MDLELPSFLVWSVCIKCLVHHEVYSVSWSCLLSFLCNPYIPFQIYEILYLLVYKRSHLQHKRGQYIQNCSHRSQYSHCILHLHTEAGKSLRTQEIMHDHSIIFYLARYVNIYYILAHNVKTHLMHQFLPREQSSSIQPSSH